MRLQGQIAIVTGSTQGIGAPIGRRYAREGAKVAIALTAERPMVA